MKVREGFSLREVCGEQVVMGEGLGVVDFRSLVGLNETAAFLWKEAEKLGDFTVEQLADTLLGEYNVERDVAIADVERTINEWLQAGIVEN